MSPARWRYCRDARAFERPAARRDRTEAQPDQAGDAVVSARPDQPGDRNHSVLCHRRRAVCRGRHFPDRSLPCRHHRAVSLDRNRIRAILGVWRGRRDCCSSIAGDLCRARCGQAQTPSSPHFPSLTSRLRVAIKSNPLEPNQIEAARDTAASILLTPSAPPSGAIARGDRDRRGTTGICRPA